MKKSYQLPASGASSRRLLPSRGPSRIRSWCFPSSVVVGGRRKNKGRVVSLSVFLLCVVHLCAILSAVVYIPDGPWCSSYPPSSLGRTLLKAYLACQLLLGGLTGLVTLVSASHCALGGCFIRLCLVVFLGCFLNSKQANAKRAQVTKEKEQASGFACSNLVVSFAASASSFGRLDLFYFRCCVGAKGGLVVCRWSGRR